MQASGFVIVSPDCTAPGQELHSCITSILSQKLEWSVKKTSEAAKELEWAFQELGIVDKNILTYFDDPAFWTEPNAAQLEAMGITCTCFTAIVKAMIVKIAKNLRSAQLESSNNCFLGPTATIDSLLNWSDVMQNPRKNDTGCSSGQSSAGGDGGSGPNTGSRTSELRKVKDIKIKPFKGEVYVDGDKFLAHVRDQFNKQAVGDYLVDESVCSKDPSRSLAFLTHLRESVADHRELGCLTVASKNNKSCAKFFSELTKVLENCETKLGRECHLVNRLMELSCDDLDSFGDYYSDITIVIQKLEEDNPTLVSNDSFLHVFFHNRIHVEGLKLLTTKLLNDFTSSARAILLEMNQIYCSHKVSVHMRQQNPGQTASMIKKMRKTEASPTKETGEATTKKVYVPRNFNSAIPDKVYKQFKEWHGVASKYPKTDTDIAFLKTWKYKTPKPPSKGSGGKGNYTPRKDYKMDKDYNELKKKVRRMETKNDRMKNKLHDRDMSTSSTSHSHSCSPPRGRDRDRRARCGRYCSPTPPHRPKSRDREGYSRARHTCKEQFFQAHNAAMEYRKDSERKRSSDGR